MPLQFLPPIKRGDDWKKKLTVTLGDGGIGDCFIRMHIRERMADALPKIAINSDGTDADGNSHVAAGIEKLSATEFTIELTHDQTETLKAPWEHYADIEFTLPNGNVETMRNLAPAVMVTADVTR